MRLLVALVLVLGLTAAAEPKATLPDIEDEVMCVECRTALNISTSAVADQERAFIRARIAEGMTKDEIKAALVDEYGPGRARRAGRRGLRPRGLAGAGSDRRARRRSTVVLLARRWRRAPEPAPAAPGPELDAADARRLDAELRAFDR